MSNGCRNTPPTWSGSRGRNIGDRPTQRHLQPSRQPRLSRLSSLITVDPVGAGLVASLTRPGGNVTGFTVFETSNGGKVAGATEGDRSATSRASAVFVNPDSAGNVGPQVEDVQAAANALGLRAPGRMPPASAELERGFAHIWQGSRRGAVRYARW